MWYLRRVAPIIVFLSRMTHINCRGLYYPRSEVPRFPISDERTPWTELNLEYKPPCFTSPAVIGKPWADPEIDDFKFHPKWNALDENVNRCSHMGQYDVVDGYPRNPVGRTGIVGRGILGKWGPNHAADPIVTRWKRDANNEIIKLDSSQMPILQFVAIRRRDSGEWAIPGGMVDPGEKVTATLKREFQEEALNIMEASDKKRSMLEAMVNSFFDSGEEVYRGYVDDPRNTDNAWMETVAVNFHDESGTSVGAFPLHAGDDAVGVCWMDISSQLKLYANHVQFIQKVAEKHGAQW